MARLLSPSRLVVLILIGFSALSLYKLKTVDVDSVKEVYVDEVITDQESPGHADPGDVLNLVEGQGASSDEAVEDKIDLNYEDFAAEDNGIPDVPPEFRPESSLFFKDVPRAPKKKVYTVPEKVKGKAETEPKLESKVQVSNLKPEVVKEIGKKLKLAEERRKELEERSKFPPPQMQVTAKERVEPMEPKQIQQPDQNVAPELSNAENPNELPTAPQPNEQVNAAGSEEAVPEVKRGPNGDSWEQEQLERRQMIKGYCTASRIPGDVSFIREKSGATGTWSGNYLVDDVNQVIFCNIPKTASTYLKLALVNHSGNVQFDEDQPPSKLQSVHRWDFLTNGDISGLNENPPDAVLSKIATYKKFMFTRNPVDRFIGAYREKLEDTIRLPGVNEMVMQFNNPDYNQGVDGQKHVTFEEFTNWFVASGQTTDNWNHYHLGCSPCFVDYDFIGQVENLDRDLKHIVDRVYGYEAAQRLEDTAPMIRESTKQRLQHTHGLAKSYLSSLSPELKEKLYEAYNTDAALFGYDMS